MRAGTGGTYGAVAAWAMGIAALLAPSTALAHTNVTITSGATTNGAFMLIGSEWTFVPNAGADTATVNDTDIESFANVGSDVRVTTQSTGSNPGDIGVSQAVSWTGAGNVTLEAESSIAVNAAITSSSGGLNLAATAGVTAGSALTIAGATIVNAGAGAIGLDNLGNNFTGAVSLFNDPGNDATVTDTNALTLGESRVGSDLFLNSGGAVTQTGALNVPDSANIAGGGASDVVLTNPGNDFGSAQVTNSDDVAVADANDLVLGTVTIGGDLTSTAADQLTVPPSTQVSAGGAARLISDAQAPSAPSIGTGGIAIGAGAQVSGAGAIALYTARREQNAIDPAATLNGAQFTPGPLFSDSPREVWSTYFPSGTASAPFTFFYKDGSSSDAAPDTQITKGPKDKTKQKTASFEFTGTDARAISGFQCKVDSGAFAPCTSPFKVRVKGGKHAFEVRAVDQAANVDPTPAIDTWKVKKKKRKR